jgi:dTDP-4-amino-4,6-dideoxygalactose transaminase
VRHGRALPAIAKQHNLKVIEDCAHAIETEANGQKAGTIGDFACFSFYVTKNVITGEGGMIVARDENDIARAKMLALARYEQGRLEAVFGRRVQALLCCGMRF